MCRISVELPREGVYAAYMDVMYDDLLVDVNGPIEFNPVYSNQQSGNTATPGLIDEVGAFDGFTPLGESERLLFSLPFLAETDGIVVFASDPADVLPAHDTLLYGLGQPVPVSQIEYGIGRAAH